MSNQKIDEFDKIAAMYCVLERTSAADQQVNESLYSAIKLAIRAQESSRESTRGDVDLERSHRQREQWDLKFVGSGSSRHGQQCPAPFVYYSVPSKGPDFRYMASLLSAIPLGNKKKNKRGKEGDNSSRPDRSNASTHPELELMRLYRLGYRGADLINRVGSGKQALHQTATHQQRLFTVVHVDELPSVLGSMISGSSWASVTTPGEGEDGGTSGAKAIAQVFSSDASSLAALYGSFMGSSFAYDFVTKVSDLVYQEMGMLDNMYGEEGLKNLKNLPRLQSSNRKNLLLILR
jgi:hypothetical protein